MKLAALFVALFLGLGWAIRGHFGHEWGAAWAGGIAALATVVAAKRTDWLRRLPVLAALGALLSFGPQKYFDAQFHLIWPAVIAGQVASAAAIYCALRPVRNNKHAS